MWFSPEVLARIRSGLPANATSEEVAEAKAKQELEKLIEEVGWGECAHCNEDIIKNGALNVWESEFLVGYCSAAKDGKHKPDTKKSEGSK